MKKLSLNFILPCCTDTATVFFFQLLLLEVFSDSKTISPLACGWKGEMTVNSLAFLRTTVSSAKCLLSPETGLIRKKFQTYLAGTGKLIGDGREENQ